MKSNRLLKKIIVKLICMLAFLGFTSYVYSSNNPSVCSPTEFVPAGASFKLIDSSKRVTYSPIELKPKHTYIVNKSIHVFDAKPLDNTQYLLNKSTTLSGSTKATPVHFVLDKTVGVSETQESPNLWLFEFSHNGRSGYVSVSGEEISTLPFILENASPLLTLPPGTQISSVDQANTQIHGIPYNINSPLTLKLAQSQSMAITSKYNMSARLSVISPQKVTSGATVTLNMQNEQIDFNGHRIEVCTKNAQGKFEQIGSTITNTEGGSVNYQIRLPHDFTIGNTGQFDIVLTAWKGKQLTFMEYVTVNINSNLSALAESLMYMIALGVVASLLMGKKGNPFALGIGRSEKYSLSQCQTLGWSLVVLFSIIYIWNASGTLPDLNQELYVLLGVSLLTSAGAKGAAIKREKADWTHQPLTHLQAKTSEGKNVSAESWNGMIIRENRPELLRLQLLVFTLLTWAFVLYQIWDRQQMPDLPAFLLALSGLSNAGYLSSKFIGRKGKMATLSSQIITDVGQSQISKVQRILNIPQTGVQDDATTASVSQYQKHHGMLPSDGLITSALADHVNKPGQDRTFAIISDY